MPGFLERGARWEPRTARGSSIRPERGSWRPGPREAEGLPQAPPVTSRVRSRVRRGRASSPQRPGLPAGLLARCTRPRWPAGPPHAQERGVPPRPAPGPPSSSRLSGTHGVHSAARVPVQAPPPGVRNPCVRPGPEDHPQDPRRPAPPRPRPRCPFPAPPSPGLGGGARFGDPGEAQLPRPQVRRVTGRAGSSSRGRGHWRRRGRPRGRAGLPSRPNAPGGRYLVGGHRAEALEDGQDVLLAGVPHRRRKPRRGCPSRTGRADLERLPPPGA